MHGSYIIHIHKCSKDYEVVCIMYIPLLNHVCSSISPELSPIEFQEKHMVLPLNLIDTDHHKDYAVEVLQEYGQVSEGEGVRVDSVSEGVCVNSWKLGIY